MNKFYWKLEYDDMQPAFKSGDIWVTYAWPNDYNDMLAAGLKTGYHGSVRGAAGVVLRIHHAEGLAELLPQP